MGCYLGVAEASLTPPAFIHLRYSPVGGAHKKARAWQRCRQSGTVLQPGQRCQPCALCRLAELTLS